jgi:3',5'-cyclic AMP phosphodiesterase CpdA
MRIAVIADSHLSPRAMECVQNWYGAARAVGEAQALLTVHLGDITLDGVRDADELAFAKELVDEWPTPMLCVPGNHDIGTGSGEEAFSALGRARYLRTFGADHWSVPCAGWLLIGLNAQLLGTNTAAEASQWDWLEREVQGLDEFDRVALFLHRPLVRAPGDAGMPMGRYVGASHAQRLLRGPLRRSLKLVMSGHTHQALEVAGDGVQHIWVPSCAFVISDALQAPVGRKIVGMWVLRLDAAAPSYQALCPSGAARNVLRSSGRIGEPHGQLVREPL